MKKITKKEFIDTLCNHESIQCGIVHYDLTESQKDTLRTMTWDSMSEEGEIRRVDRRMSNAIMFSNGSYLYFDVQGEKSYYRIGNAILQRVHTTDRYNPDYKYTKILCYLINY